jgi:methylated-DNA-[protein]-cysteine S-methyltransferase
MTRYVLFETSLGDVYATANESAVTGVYFVGGRHAPAIDPAWREDAAFAPLAACAAQLREYLAGSRREFDLPLAPEGTPFQRAVWREIARVPYGETVSYAVLAERAGREGAARAAGAATGRNPLSIVVPCHRIVGSAGSLTGYAGGLERKARLLGMERGLAGLRLSIPARAALHAAGARSSA